jgi:site-specific DNA-methyltransferase (adenine-specific)
MPSRRHTPRKTRTKHINHIYRATALDLAATIHDGTCDLIYMDPPFFSGRRRRVANGNGFHDGAHGGLDRYLNFLDEHFVQCHRLLAPQGTLWVHLDWRTVHYVKIRLDAIFGHHNFLNEIIWHYRTGGVAPRWFGRKHDTILVYSRRRGRHRFHQLRGGAYRTDGLRRDGERPYKQTRRGRLYFHPDGPALTDVWDLPFLATVSKERVGWPTQKPLALLERIVRAASDPGDLVADFFCGSGTTLVAAARLGRRWLGCDVSSTAVRLARKRLASVAGVRAACPSG